MKKTVAILGAGPSGLVAAHAAEHADCLPVVYSRKSKSPIWGAQYLHGQIPGLPCGDPKLIRYVMRGDPTDYLRKVYADKWDGTISDELRTQAHLAYDLRSAYGALWERWHPMITSVELEPSMITSVLDELSGHFDLIINTMPRRLFCTVRHQFKSTNIYAMGDTDDRQTPFRAPEGQIIYNGESEPSWYRASTINGFSTLEWPGRQEPPYEGAVPVAKPLGHDCTCTEEWPKVKHLGRMGRWQNGALLHHVYTDTIEEIMIREETEG